jgi:hypothetical protein
MSDILSRRKRRKVGRPSLHRTRVLTNAERCKRYRQNKEREAKRNNWEWYLRAHDVAAVRKALGRIDLDPATSELAQTVVRAKTYFTLADNGLTKEWRANSLLLNPPYNDRMMNKFVDKLLAEIANGHVKQAILICHPKTDTRWWHRAAANCSCICFAKRIKFWSPDKPNAMSPTVGTAFLYYGKHTERFINAFKPYGFFCGPFGTSRTKARSYRDVPN